MCTCAKKNTSKDGKKKKLRMCKQIHVCTQKAKSTYKQNVCFHYACVHVYSSIHAVTYAHTCARTHTQMNLCIYVQASSMHAMSFVVLYIRVHAFAYCACMQRMLSRVACMHAYCCMECIVCVRSYLHIGR